MRIVKLAGSNFKKLVAFEITPDGNVVAVTGPNGAGKTSVLDAIAAAFAGPKGLKDRGVDRPIRQGETQARIVCETEDFTLTRKFMPGKQTLEIKPKGGKSIQESPQSFLDRIVGAISFDPLAFSEMKDKDQRETLLRVLGLNLDEHDAKINVLRDERKVMLAEKKRADDVLESASHYAGLPDEEISVSFLGEQLRQAHEINSRLATLEKVIESTDKQIATHKATIERLQGEIVELQSYRTKVLAEGQQLSYADTTEIEKQIATAEETNKKIRANVAHRSARAASESLSVRIKEKYDAIQQAEAGKSNAIGAAKLPVKGLGIDENGLTLDGIPFRQVNHAMRLQVSVAVGMAMNPDLRVMCCNGNGLDKESLKIIGEIAKANDFQLWMEVATDQGEGYGVEIEEGKVNA